MGANTGEPVQHIIEAKTKFQDLQKQASEKQTNLHLQILEVKQKIDNEKSDKKILSEQINELQKQLQQIDFTKIDFYKNKIEQQQKIQQELEQKQQKLNEQQQFVQKENEELTYKKRNTDDIDTLENNSQQAEIKRLQDSIAFYEDRINQIKSQKEELLDLTNQDIKTNEIKERNEEIQKLLQDKESQYDRLEYEVQELECLQRLGLEDKQKSLDERKQLANEVEVLQQQLEETKNLNQQQIERKIHQKADEQVEKKDTELRIEKQEIIDIKEKYDDIHRVYTKYYLERNQRFYSLQTIKEQNEILQQELNDLKKQYEELQQKTSQIKASHEQQQLDKKEKRIKLKNLELQKFELLRQINGLKSEINFLCENFNLREKMKELKLDELKQVIQLNQNVNKTLEGLINQWDDLKKIGTNQLTLIQKKYKSLFTMSNMKQGLKLFSNQNQNDKKQQSQYQQLDADEFKMDTHNITENTTLDQNKKGVQIKKTTKWGAEDDEGELPFNNDDQNIGDNTKQKTLNRALNKWNTPVQGTKDKNEEEKQKKIKELQDNINKEQAQKKKVVKKNQPPKQSGKDLSKWMSREEDQEQKKKLEEERLRRLKELEDDDKDTKQKPKQNQFKKDSKQKLDKFKTKKTKVTKKEKTNKQQTVSKVGITSGKTWDD